MGYQIVISQIIAFLMQMFGLGTISYEGLHTARCDLAWILSHERATRRHTHRCVKTPYHNGDCKCRCGKKDRTGEAGFDYMMQARGDFYMHAQVVKRPVLVEMMAEIGKETGEILKIKAALNDVDTPPRTLPIGVAPDSVGESGERADETHVCTDRDA